MPTYLRKRYKFATILRKYTILKIVGKKLPFFCWTISETRENNLILSWLKSYINKLALYPSWQKLNFLRKTFLVNKRSLESFAFPLGKIYILLYWYLRSRYNEGRFHGFLQHCTLLCSIPRIHWVFSPIEIYPSLLASAPQWFGTLHRSLFCEDWKESFWHDFHPNESDLDLFRRKHVDQETKQKA